MSDRDDDYGGGGAGLAWSLLAGLSLMVVLAGILSGCAVGRSGGPAGQQEHPSQRAGEEQAPGKEASRDGARLGHPALGEKDAPVVMLEYSDYQ